MSLLFAASVVRRLDPYSYLLRLAVIIGMAALPLRAHEPGDELDRGLIGYWPLAGDARDRSGNGRDALPHGSAEFEVSGPAGQPRSAMRFNGRNTRLEIPAGDLPKLGSNPFTVAAWVQLNDQSGDVPGDIISQYDGTKRSGFHLSIKTNAVTTSLANHRQLSFGIDHDRSSEWVDCGKPGNALLAFSLAVFKGSLYAGTCEPGAAETGRVYRYDGGTRWSDCGAPDRSNSVTALAVHDGRLYAATGKYRVAGSALPESENKQIGGRIFRYDHADRWTDCGQLPETEAVGGLVVFRGQLYASSLYRPAGFYRYDGERRWIDCGTPDGKRVVALGIYNDNLYAASYDGGHVYRYDGDHWTDCGQLGDNTQTYSFAVYQGQLYVGTWPSGRVYRYERDGEWTDTGRLGDELEVMGMLVHNGRLIAGTLPLAEVYQYEGDSKWRRLTRLDDTPEVKYRRAWTMAEHDGKVYCSTLPSGRIFSFEAGRTAMGKEPFPAGWHHVAAVKSDGRLILYLDGRELARSTSFEPGEYPLDPSVPLQIGFGPNDTLDGSLAHVRLYQRALSEDELRSLVAEKR